MQRFVAAIGSLGFVSLQGCSEDKPSQIQNVEVSSNDHIGATVIQSSPDQLVSEPVDITKLPAGSVKLENVVYLRENADEPTQRFYTTMLQSLSGQLQIFAVAHDRHFQHHGDQTFHWISYTKEDVPASREENIRQYRSMAKSQKLTTEQLQDAMIHYCFDVEVILAKEDAKVKKTLSEKANRKKDQVEVWRVTFKMIPPATLQDPDSQDSVGSLDGQLMKQFLPQAVQIDMSPQVAELSSAYVYPSVLDTTDVVKVTDL